MSVVEHKLIPLRATDGPRDTLGRPMRDLRISV
jgi:hypothetical protein